MAMLWQEAYAAMHRAGDAAFPPACLAYVLTTVREASLGREAPLTPAELVTLFREKLRRDFGPLLRDVTEDWALRTPADFGNAVLLLGRYGCLTLEPHDTPEAYAEHPLPFHDERSAT